MFEIDDFSSAPDWFIPPDEITEPRVGAASLYVIARRLADPAHLQAHDLFIASIADAPDGLAVWLSPDSADDYVAERFCAAEPNHRFALFDHEPKVLTLSLEQIRHYLPLEAPLRLGISLMDTADRMRS